MGCVANSTDNNFTAARVFTKNIAADPGDISLVSKSTSWRVLGERPGSCNFKWTSIAGEGKRSKEIADVNLSPLVHIFENAECRLPLSLEFVYAQANVDF